jgi:hypothetical protein
MSINLKNHGLFDVDVDFDVGRVLEHESVLQVVPNIQKKIFFLLEWENQGKLAHLRTII